MGDEYPNDLDYDEPKTVRCWVTLRIAVDVETEDDRPTAEELHEQLISTLSDYALDSDHVTWGVEGQDEPD